MNEQPVYILHLETSTRVCSASLSMNGQTLAVYESDDEHYAHGEKLTLYIDECLKKAAITYTDLSAVCVSSGPGSYTGLRIGVSTAKGLCYALGIPLISVGSLESLAALAIASDNTRERYCAMIDARRTEVYAAIFDANGKVLKSTSADIIEADSYSEYEPFAYFGDGAAKLSELWTGKNCTELSGIRASATGQHAIAFRKFQSGNVEDVAYFEPFYLKDFAAGKKPN